MLNMFEAWPCESVLLETIGCGFFLAERCMTSPDETTYANCSTLMWDVLKNMIELPTWPTPNGSQTLQHSALRPAGLKKC